MLFLKQYGRIIPESGEVKILQTDYTGKDIKILEGLEAVRTRPSMYIGNTGTEGLHHLIWEIVDNSVDEASSGFAHQIILELNPDNSISVTDDGRGIPVDLHPEKKIPTERVILTILHAGGKFGQGAYQKSGGLHGVGSSVVNALSRYLHLTVWRDGYEYHDQYQQGKPLTKLVQQQLVGKKSSHRTGTRITFLPDPEIFSDTTWDWDLIQQHLKHEAYLNKNVVFKLINHQTQQTLIYHEKNGVAGFIKDLNQKRKTLSNIALITGMSNNINVEIAFQYLQEFSESEELYYTNNVLNENGGTHATGFRTGLTKLVKNYAATLGLIKNANLLKGSDIRSGLVSVVAIAHPDPSFEGQTKDKLNNTDVIQAVSDVMLNKGTIYFDRHVEDMKKIINHAAKHANEKQKLRQATMDVTSKEVRLKTNSKLAPANSHSKHNELFLVEGNSAGGSAKKSRNRKFQAILPLRGKILNVERADQQRILHNEEINTFVAALGTNYGTKFDMSKLRYDKILIMTDADVDGGHITTLLLTLMFTLMPELIAQGHVFLTVPPLYRIRLQKNDQSIYAYSEFERDQLVRKYRQKIAGISRFKGLGEMDANELKLVMDPQTRKLQKITLTDFDQGEEVTAKMMGTKSLYRRQLFTKYGDLADVDDIGD